MAIEIIHTIRLDSGLEHLIARKLEGYFSKIDFLTSKFEKFMSNTSTNLDQLNASLDAASVKMDAVIGGIGNVKTSVDGIGLDVADLKKQLQNTGLSDAQLAPILAKAQAIENKVNTASQAITDLGIEASDLDAETTEPVATAVTLQDGTIITIDQAGEVPAPGDAVKDSAGNQEPAGTYTTVDGATLVVGDDGNVVSYTATS